MNLVYGYNGEFGWEIASQYPEVAHACKTHDVSVCTFPESAGLYADLPINISTHTQTKRRNMQGNFSAKDLPESTSGKFVAVGGRKYPDGSPKGMDFRVPRQDIQEETDQGLIVVHARRITEKGFTKVSANKRGRNWKDVYNPVGDKLLKEGYRVVCIGAKGHAVCPFGENAVGASFEATVRLIKAARFVLGPSSGTTVLSLWCGTPVFTWGCLDNRYIKDRPHRGGFWNPHKVTHYHPWCSGNYPDTGKYFKERHVPSIDVLLDGLQHALDSKEPVSI
jgi:hypothetical protein